MVNRSPGGRRLLAHRAVLGKHPGRPMGYEVLRSSLPDDRASGYLWRAAATGAPEGRDPEGALPWRVFLAASDTRPTPACARVETGWDGTTDGTGAPAYTWQLALFDWPDVSDAALTWTGIDRALSALPADGSEGEDPTAVTVPDTSAAELAALVDELGFPWAAGVAALLLDDRQVALTTSPALPLPDVAERVRVLDAICSLLPYACRSWLSAATWTGQAGHDLRLFFAPAVREGQSTAVYGGAPPPGPRGDAARGYLRRLLALRAKTGDTHGLVRHLLAATGPATSAPEPYGTLKALREADLLDTVVEEIGAGAGEPAEAARVLQRHPADSLDDRRLAVLTGHLLAHVRGARAGALLAAQWSGRLCAVLVEQVLAAGDPARSFERARCYLGAVHAEVEPHRPGSFADLFHALLDAPSPPGDWAGSLIYMAEDQWGRATDRADRLLLGDEAVARTWLRYLLKNRRRSLQPLARLVRRARSEGSPAATPGWLRFAAVLLGGDAEATTATDAADFAEASDQGWRTTLDIAREQRRPEALRAMWPGLWRAARGDRALGEAVAGLVPVDGRHDGGVAADADLFCAATGTGGPGMPRLALLTESGQLTAYVAALINRCASDGELRRLAVDALLAGTPGPRGWQVTEQLAAALPAAFLGPVCEVVHDRLTGRGRALTDLDVPPYLMKHVAARYDLAWLRPVSGFRRAAESGAPYEELARLLLEAGVPVRLPAQLLDAVAGWTLTEGPDGLEQVARAMDAAAPSSPGPRLYGALTRDDRHPGLREMLTEHSRHQRAWHEAVLAELWHRRPGAPPAAAPAAEVERPGLFRKMGRAVSGRRG
ncbi:hypothetical protein ABTZ92_18310 [Streptomyces albidoflavus]|uniref:hypothetical protein n=1 Tax=Streptomyces albidoflavus TaxID=1886 RepID=UPI00331D2549